MSYFVLDIDFDFKTLIKSSVPSPMLPYLVSLNGIDVYLGVCPGTWPAIIEKRLCFHQLLPLLLPIFWFVLLPNIFDKSTIVLNGIHTLCSCHPFWNPLLYAFVPAV